MMQRSTEKSVEERLEFLACMALERGDGTWCILYPLDPSFLALVRCLVRVHPLIPMSVVIQGNLIEIVFLVTIEESQIVRV